MVSLVAILLGWEFARGEPRVFPGRTCVQPNIFASEQALHNAQTEGRLWLAPTARQLRAHWVRSRRSTQIRGCHRRAAASAATRRSRPSETSSRSRWWAEEWQPIASSAGIACIDRASSTSSLSCSPLRVAASRAGPEIAGPARGSHGAPSRMFVVSCRPKGGDPRSRSALTGQMHFVQAKVCAWALASRRITLAGTDHVSATQVDRL